MRLLMTCPPAVSSRGRLHARPYGPIPHIAATSSSHSAWGGATGRPATPKSSGCWSESPRRSSGRCWETGVGRRSFRPGCPSEFVRAFWDNNGRCCGTAGVLALACDRIVERGDGFAFADLLYDDLASRASIDKDGARWSNQEHRNTPPDLSPRSAWAMGNAGIVRELLRYSRLCSGSSDGAYSVSWPDHINSRSPGPRVVATDHRIASKRAAYPRHRDRG